MQIIIIESAEELAEQIVKHQDAAHISTRDAILACLHPIKVPSDAVKLVKKIREGSVFRHDLSERYYKLLDAEAAALITAHPRKVPRAMLDEIYSLGYSQGTDCASLEDDGVDNMAAIIAKYGYHVE